MSIQFEKKHADKDSTNASQQSSFFFPSEDKRNLMHFREREQRFEARSVIAGELTPNIQEVERRSRKEEASGSARRAVLRSCKKAPSGKIDRRLAKFRQNVARFRLYRHRFCKKIRVLQHFSKSTRFSS